MKPLLKWPGGKRFLADELAETLRHAPIHRYFEPFAGGAALFFALQPENATLADANPELINLYTVVRDNPDELIEVLDRYGNTRDEYYYIRETRPRTPATRAARLYYLMRLSFNGIYRENRSGDFNVPYGKKTYLDVFDEELIEDAHEALQGTDLACQDFRDCVAAAGPQDLIYFDPPYTVRHNNNGFIKYNRTLFEWKDQVELSNVARDLAERGCYVVVSNADHHEVRALYDDFHHQVIKRPSIISAEAKGRGLTTELLISSPNVPMAD